MDEFNYTLELDDKLNAYLVIECPKCSNKINTPAKEAKQGSSISCSCGSSVSFSGEGFTELQRDLTDLRKTIEGFGK